MALGKSSRFDTARRLRFPCAHAYAPYRPGALELHGGLRRFLRVPCAVRALRRAGDGEFRGVRLGLVAHEEGFVIKVLAIPMFFAASVFTTIVAEVLRRRGRAPLPWALALECVLLVGFLVLGLTMPLRDANAPATVLAAMLGLSAMGVQSAVVRLLMPGVASTNVMTTNTTLFAIDTGEFLLGWQGKRGGDVEAAAQYAAARERLSHLIPLGIGFFLGTAIGAVGYVMFGLVCLAAVLVLLVGLTVWGARASLTPPSRPPP